MAGRLSYEPRQCRQCDGPVKIRSQRDVESKQACSKKCGMLVRWKQGVYGPVPVRPPIPPKTCKICGEMYQPVSARQLWCKDCIPNKAARHRYQTYGISQPDYLKRLEVQGFVCAICRRRAPEYVDHNHKTGAVRGLLCPACNTALGAFYDDYEVAERAVSYLKKKE